jgi:signal transduction histidine kinase
MVSLVEAIQHIEAGNFETGREILEQLLEKDEFNEEVWFWLSKTVEQVDTRIICLENVLAINPDNTEAFMQLEGLRVLTILSAEEGHLKTKSNLSLNEDGSKSKSQSAEEADLKTNPHYPLVNTDQGQLLSTSKTSEQMQRMLQEYYGALNHEIRVPLTAIRGYSELLLSNKVGPLNEKQEKYLTVLKNVAENLIEVFEDSANFYRVISGNLLLRFEEVDLIEILSQMRLDSFNLNIPSNLPKILADRRHIQQALKNVFTQVFPWHKVDEFRPSVKLSYDNCGVTINIVTLLEEVPRLFDDNYSGPWLYYAQVVLEEHRGQFRFRKVEDKLEITLWLPITQDKIVGCP